MIQEDMEEASTDDSTDTTVDDKDKATL